MKTLRTEITRNYSEISEYNYGNYANFFQKNRWKMRIYFFKNLLAHISLT